MNVNVVLLLLSLNYPLGDTDDHNAHSTDMFPESYYPRVVPLLVALVLHSSSYAFHYSMLQQLSFVDDHCRCLEVATIVVSVAMNFFLDIL